MSKFDGISVALCFGRPAWPQFNYCSSFVRIVFGPIALWLLFRDFDVAMGLVQRFATKKEPPR